MVMKFWMRVKQCEQAAQLTVFWCSLGGVGAPAAPVTMAISGIFTAHLSDIYCVWFQFLESEWQDVFDRVHKRDLKNNNHSSVRVMPSADIQSERTWTWTHRQRWHVCSWSLMLGALEVADKPAARASLTRVKKRTLISFIPNHLGSVSILTLAIYEHNTERLGIYYFCWFCWLTERLACWYMPLGSMKWLWFIPRGTRMSEPHIMVNHRTATRPWKIQGSITPKVISWGLKPFHHLGIRNVQISCAIVKENIFTSVNSLKSTCDKSMLDTFNRKIKNIWPVQNAQVESRPGVGNL